METVQQWLDTIHDAGFVKLTKGDLVAPDFVQKVIESYTTTTCYFHASVLEMPEEEQKQQPWIEHHVYAKWMNHPDNIEGRFGAMRYPFRCLNDLHLFMRNFGYTYQKSLNQ